MRLTAEQKDRAAGVIAGAATGDALGVPYEFKPALRATDTPVMRGGGLGPYAPGEFSDDTQMTVMVADVAIRGFDLRKLTGLSHVARGFLRWRKDGATDIGAQTSAVLSSAEYALRTHPDASPGYVLAHMAEVHHKRTGRSGGNGSLMRTSPVALAYLRMGGGPAMSEAARKVSALTHFDADAGDACVLWCAMIRHAVRTGQLDSRRALRYLPRGRRQLWAERLADATAHAPGYWQSNGWVVTALQAAYSAVIRADGKNGRERFTDALQRAVRAGDDTDTVAAIAGALAGALYGASSIPCSWPLPGTNEVARVHGWPGVGLAELQALGAGIAQRA